MARLWMLTLLLPLLIAAGVVYVVLKPLVVFDVGANPLSTSLERKLVAKSASDRVRCTERRAEVRYACVATTDSGELFLAVRVDDEGCWTARQVNKRGRPQGNAKPVEECLDVVDYAGVTFL